jgi:hypothetical protein
MIENEQTDEPRNDGTNNSLVVRELVGVVAAITPWNGPLSSPTLKVAPALAAGCSMILKPPPETPLTAYLLADAFTTAGLPECVLSILPADREVGEHLVRHAQVDKVAFTGSTAAGRKVVAICAERIAQVTLELGGKSAAIVLDDADLEHLIRTLLPMATMVNGQACMRRRAGTAGLSSMSSLRPATMAAPDIRAGIPTRVATLRPWSSRTPRPGLGPDVADKAQVLMSGGVGEYRPLLRGGCRIGRVWVRPRRGEIRA